MTLQNAETLEKIDTLATNLANTNKPLEDIYTLIDNKFSNQVRKITYNIRKNEKSVFSFAFILLIYVSNSDNSRALFLKFGSIV